MNRIKLILLGIITFLLSAVNVLNAQNTPDDLKGENTHQYDISFVRSLPYDLNVYYSHIPLYQVNHLPSYNLLALLQGRARNEGSQSVSHFHLETTINGNVYQSETVVNILRPNNVSSIMIVPTSLNGKLNYGENYIKMEVVLENDIDQDTTNNYEEGIMIATDGLYALDYLNEDSSLDMGYGTQTESTFGNVYAIANDANQALTAFYLAFTEDAVVGTPFQLIVYEYYFSYGFLKPEPIATFDLVITPEMVGNFVKIPVPALANFLSKINTYGMIYCAINQLNDEPINIAVDGHERGIVYKRVYNSNNDRYVLQNIHDYGSAALRIDFGQAPTTVGEPPVDLLASDVRKTTARLSWNSDYACQVQINNQEPILVLGKNYIDLTGLQAETTYSWRVRNVVSDELIGEWVEGEPFTTNLHDGPYLAVSADSLMFTVAPLGLTDTLSLDVMNVGLDTLVVSFSCNDLPEWLSFENIQFNTDYEVVGNQPITVNAVCNADDLPAGEYSTELNISHNSYENSDVKVIHISVNVREEVSVTFVEQDGVSFVGNDVAVVGEDYIFNVFVDDEYSQSVITVMANGVPVSQVDSVTYCVNDVTEDLVISVDGLHLNVYDIVAVVEPSAAGTVEGTGSYSHYETAVLNAVANEGYSFVNWTENSNVVCEDTHYEFVVTCGRNLVANFNLNSYEITAEVNPANSATITGTGVYNHFQTVSLVAIINEGYSFVNWTENENVVCESPVYAFTVTCDRNLVANLTLNSYEITAELNLENSATITGAGTYNHFETVTLEVTPNEGYSFVNWTENSNVVCEQPVYEFIANSNRNLIANLYLNSYEIIATASPENSATITGAGTYNHFETVTLEATANEGYSFLNWTENSDVVCEQTVYEFVANSDRTLVANMSLNSYEIIATANPENSATITGTGTYNHFETVFLMVLPAEGYSFVNWTENDQVVSEETIYIFDVEGERNLIANLSINTFQISATANPVDGGTIAGAGTYNYNETATLTASANEGYSFVNWTENDELVSVEPTLEIVVLRNRDFVANFEINSYEISAVAMPQEGGSITGAGTYNYFETATLEAFANDGYNFVNWTENGQEISNETILSFEVVEDRSFEANFQLKTYSIETAAYPVEAGVTSGDGSYSHFEEVTVTASSNDGYHFVDWRENEISVSEDASYTFVVTSSRSLVANFSINVYTISVATDPQGAGSIIGAGDYEHGENVTLVAVSDEVCSFIHWTENDEFLSDNDTLSFVADSNRDLVAVYEYIGYSVTALTNPEGAGTVSGFGIYNYGDETTLSTSANVGYSFLNWTENDEVVSENESFTIEVTHDRTFVANYQILTYNLSLSAEPQIGGTVSGEGVYQHGDMATASALNNEGYTFQNWTENGEVVSDMADYSFEMVGDRNLTAHFTLNTYSISLLANPEVGGSVSGAGNYEYGETATVVAEANEGYMFINWTEDDQVVAEDVTYSFVVNSNRSLVANFSLLSFNITANVNPVNSGIVSGDGSYLYGTEATLSATANEGYLFENWTENGQQVCADETYTFEVTSDRTLVANFVIETYEIQVSANPEDGGTVSGDGTYQHGDEVAVIATANEGYAFENWTENGQQVSADETYTFEVTSDRTLVANFVIATYEIQVSANPEDGGTVNGGGTYQHGDNVIVIATPNEGYEFDNWMLNGSIVSEDATYSFIADADRNLIANFSLQLFNISAVAYPVNAGTISGGGDYQYGTEITLSATANEGYLFENWTEDGQEVCAYETYTFEVTSDRTLVANFVIATYEIQVSASPENGGTVNGGGTYQHGDEVEVVATPNEGYAFVNWTEDGEIVSEDDTYSFVVYMDRDLMANFSMESYNIVAFANPSGAGSVSGSGNYQYGTEITLSATANEGYLFENWTESGQEVSDDNDYTFEVTCSRVLIANFEIKTYEIEVSANPENGGTVSGGGTYQHGDDVTVSAIANEGYSFQNWTENNEIVSEDASFSFVAETNRAFVANFSIESFDITAVASPETGGSVSGSGVYPFGSTVSLLATENEGYSFENWTEYDDVVCVDNEYSFVVTSSRTLTANFVINTYTVEVMANPAEGGEVTGGGEYQHGENVTVTAIANVGYSFQNWTENGEEVSTETSYSFEVTSSHSLQANFEIDTYYIYVSANPEEGGSVTGEGEYEYGEMAVVEAIANEGYVFENWTENDEVVSSETQYSFEVTSTRNLSANFELNVFEITLSANPSIGGSVTGAGQYNNGETATVEATANDGYTFQNWTEDGSLVCAYSVYSFEVTCSRNLVANFSLNKYDITAEANIENAGTLEGMGEYYHFETATLTATVNEGYVFENWSENGSVVSTDEVYSFDVICERHLIANFSLLTFEVVLHANPEDGGEVSGAGIYNYGETVTVVAVPNEGYAFNSWTLDGETVSEQNEYSFVINEDVELMANFTDVDGIADYQMNVAVYPNPVQSVLSVEIENAASNDVMVYVYGLEDGKLYYINKVSASEIKIDVSELAPGSYVVKVVMNGSIVNRKFIKQK